MIVIEYFYVGKLKPVVMETSINYINTLKNPYLLDSKRSEECIDFTMIYVFLCL